MTDQRQFNFSSSQIYRLMANGRAKGTLGAPFFSYIQEKINERAAGRHLSNDADANANTWGKVCEQIAHEEIGLEYVLHPDKRYAHESLPWTGAPDGGIPDKVVDDIKSPWTLTSFFEVYNDRTLEGLKGNKKEWYWQLVSNSILTGLAECELILFMPKRSMLDRIRQRSEELGYWFQHKTDDQLPWTADNSKIPAITKIRFIPLEKDKQCLTRRVQAAAKCLDDQKYFEFLKKNKKI